MSTPAVAASPLFKLPGELRNKIYRLTLLLENPIPLSTTSFTEPGLLKTSQQVRFETTQIFYVENSFSMLILNNDSSLYTRYHRSAISLGFSLGATISIAPSKNWKNLAIWLERYRTGQVPMRMPSPLTSASSVIEWGIVGALFDTAEQCQDLDPKAFKQLLKSHRAILGKFNGAWLIDHA